MPRGGLTYSEAGVDIDAGERAVDAMKDLVKSTYRAEVLGEIGAFGGLFAVPDGYRSPVLVASTDGVGTKLAVARALGRYTTVGIDLVAMCVDDLVCQGAEPLFFLDYQAHGVLSPAVVTALMEGIAEGCRQAGCAILGGELAEHPGSLDAGDFDLVGFAVGIAERDRLLGPSRVRVGDVLIGLPSPGLRSNGYSLARRALGERALDGPAWAGASVTLGDELLRPSVIYAPAIVSLLRDADDVDVRAIAHITGGGLPGNLPRVLGDGRHAVLHRAAWETPPVFAEVQRAGRIDDEEMARVFNLGLGMVVVVASGSAGAAIDALSRFGHRAAIVGEVVAGEPGVTLRSS
ncbi:MAG TPA: phosphoribosylformylglycinamidine cyclo-ligase [Acidimicrobiales bacterium]|nr:phosphoribosylformylglycinamidine cyclo-ligase [Acidimicrobiales bacterium]